jgi:cell division septum initiation protein DivIVA
MTKPDLIGAKADARLEYLLNSVKEGVRIFANAIRNSPEDTDTVAFKAFTLASKSKDEVAALFDLVMTSVAMELHEQARELVERFTFYHKVEEQDEDHSSLWWYCRKVAPPTKEEVERMAEAEADMSEAAADLPLLSVEEACAVETKA